MPKIDSIIIEFMQSLDITKLNNPERDLENLMFDVILWKVHNISNLAPLWPKHLEKSDIYVIMNDFIWKF